MKKIIAVLLTVVMLLGVIVMINVSAEETTYDVPVILTQYGKTLSYLGDEPIATAPVADGVIGDDEYTLTNEVAGDSQTGGSAYVDYEEHIAFDDEYIYYALVGNFTKGKFIDFRIRPVTNELTTDEMKEIFNRKHTSWHRVHINDDSSVTAGITTTPSSTSWSNYETAQSEVVGTFDDATGLAVIEFKINKTYLNSEWAVENATHYAYFTSFWDGNVTYGNKLNLAEKVALGNPALDEDVAPKYIITTDIPEIPETSATEPPQALEKDIREIIMDAGYGLEVDYIKATAPTIDGFWDENEWSHMHDDIYGGDESMMPKGYAGAILDNHSLRYAVEHDNEYIYVMGMFSGGVDRGLYITINAVDREGGNTPADVQAVWKTTAEGKPNFGRLTFGPAVDHVTDKPGVDAQVFVDFDGNIYQNNTDTETNKYYEVAVGKSDDAHYSLHEYKISKKLILDQVNAKYGLGLTELKYFDLTLTLDNYAYFANWGHMGATIEGAGIDPFALGMTFDDGTAIDRFGMPVYLSYEADPNPDAPVGGDITDDGTDDNGGDDATDDSSNNTGNADNTPAATTTVAEATTTVTPTTAATTAAEEKGGCGSSISIAALAVVPVLACGAAFVGKKKED